MLRCRLNWAAYHGGRLVIKSIKHKGLSAFWWKGNVRRLNPDQLPKLSRMLHALDLARLPADLNFPGWRMHPLRGDYQGYFSLTVSGNWRLVFRFDGADTADIDLVDYH